MGANCSSYDPFYKCCVGNRVKPWKKEDGSITKTSLPESKQLSDVTVLNQTATSKQDESITLRQSVTQPTMINGNGNNHLHNSTSNLSSHNNNNFDSQHSNTTTETLQQQQQRLRLEQQMIQQNQKLAQQQQAQKQQQQQQQQKTTTLNSSTSTNANTQQSTRQNSTTANTTGQPRPQQQFKSVNAALAHVNDSASFVDEDELETVDLEAHRIAAAEQARKAELLRQKRKQESALLLKKNPFERNFAQESETAESFVMLARERAQQEEAERQRQARLARNRQQQATIKHSNDDF
jgi:hypothetical protein